LKLFQEQGRRDKEEWWRGEFKYDIFDIMQELLYMPQCTLSTTIEKKFF
jgi:hypothetical protein